MTVLAPKRSTETVLYTFDFRRELKEDAISTYTIEVTSGTVTLPAADQTNLGVSITANVVGGTDGDTQAITVTVNTVGLQVLVKDYTLLIADAASAVYPSTSTKRLIVEVAFEEAGLAGYEFDATPEEYASVLRRLDLLMAEWSVNSLDLGYAFPAALGGSDLEDVSGIPDFSVNAVAISLALRAYPAIGKTMSVESRVALTNGMSVIRAKLAVIPERALPFRTPIGAGNKPWSTWWPFSGQGQTGAA